MPRLGNVRGEGLEPWAIESRELLKTRLIGKKVGVSVEYERIQSSPAQPSNVTKRIFATVKALTGKETQGQGKNVALMLVTEGVATCVKHRDGEERSSEYDSYLMAEADAASKGKCIHGTQPAPSSLSSDKLIDLTTGAECKQFSHLCFELVVKSLHSYVTQCHTSHKYITCLRNTTLMKCYCIAQ